MKVTWSIPLLVTLALVGCKKKAPAAEDAGIEKTADTAAASATAATAASPVATPSASAPTKPAFAVNDKIKIVWKGSVYPGVITAVVGKDLYRIHYDGYGKEWDETIGPSRIAGRR